MDIGCIFMFLGIAALSCVSCKTSAVGMIKEIGTVSRYYPKQYIAPKRWMRKWFPLKQHSIPRYLYLELLLSLVFAMLGPVNSVIWILTDCNRDVVGILVMLHISMIIINTIFFQIKSFMFKRK